MKNLETMMIKLQMQTAFNNKENPGVTITNELDITDKPISYILTKFQEFLESCGYVFNNGAYIEVVEQKHTLNYGLTLPFACDNKEQANGNVVDFTNRGRNITKE